MAKQVLLNYAVSFTEISGTSQVKTSYLRKAAFICKASNDSNTGLILCSTPEQVTAVTDNTDALSFLSQVGGVYIIALASADLLIDAQSIIYDNQYQFYTLVLSSDYTDTAKLNHGLDFMGVIAATFETQANAKTFAAVSDQCAGLSEVDFENAGDGISFAFGSLLSNKVNWKNQQYVEYTGNPIFAAQSVGDASNLFDDRITFYTEDDDQGVRLSFFAAGGEAITLPYVSEELKLLIQSDALQFISTNQPLNTQTMRRELQNFLQGRVNDFIDDGYLDPDGNNQIVVTKSNEQFYVNGELSVKYADPIWRMAVEATKEL